MCPYIHESRNKMDKGDGPYQKGFFKWTEWNTGGSSQPSSELSLREESGRWSTTVDKGVGWESEDQAEREWNRTQKSFVFSSVSKYTIINWPLVLESFDLIPSPSCRFVLPLGYLPPEQFNR